MVKDIACVSDVGTWRLSALFAAAVQIQSKDAETRKNAQAEFHSLSL